MSHSVVKDFPTETDNTLVIVVNKNGEVSVDQETLENLMKLGPSEVSIVRVDNDDGSTVDMTVDTFHQSESDITNSNTNIMENLSIDIQDEIARNYNSFRMDHCYTPLTSPSQQKPLPPPEEPDLELDDLAHTLSILEGSDKPPEPLTPVKTSVKVLPKILNSDKVTLLNKVNKIGVNKVYKGVKAVLKSAKTFKKPPEQQFESEPEDEDDDDLNDSDFELNESPPKFKHSNKRIYRRRGNKIDNTEISNEMRNKIVKVRKGVKHIVYKAQTPQKTLPSEPKTEPAPLPEPVKSPDSKKLPKKEKKPPKPVVDDGIALFSTPDIIRRVGSGKTGDKLPESPESPTKIKPARIEDRAKSETGRHSTDSKTKSPHRHSLDSRLSSAAASDKPKPDKHIHRSVSADKVSETLTSNFDQPIPESSNPSNLNPPETIASISDAINSLEAAPPTEIINSIINTADVKPFVTAMDTQSVIPVVDMNTITPAVEPSPLLETGLDIDQGILDNINADELIPEDILYQVAKLVENPDVQNVIDRTLVDLEPTIQAPIAQQSTTLASVVNPQPTTPHTQTISTPSTLQTQQQITPKATPQRPIQIVRSDGRVVILPPIEKPATRSSKKKQEPEHTVPLLQEQQPQQQQLQIQLQPVQLQQPQISTPQPVGPVKVQNIRPVSRLQGDFVEDIPKSDLESDSDDSWNSEDDPDRLWCICKQPHNNRFMICCDTCEDWFHGKCVNVTKAMGQQMEQQGKEWMCPNCIKKVNNPNATTPIPNLARPAKVQSDIMKRKSTESGPSCIVCSAPSRANSVYCSDACILKHAQGVEKDSNKAHQKNSSQRIIVFERSTGKCLSGPNAPTASNLKQWLREHPGFEVVRPVSKQNLVQSKLQLVKNRDGLGLAVNRKGVQVGVLPHAAAKQQPSTIKLIPAAKMTMPGAKTQPPKLKDVQSVPIKTKLIQTTLKSPTTTPTSPQIKPKPVTTTPTTKIEKTPPVRERKQKLQLIQQETPKQNVQENIRDTVKKTLYEQLITRLKDVEDIKLTEDEVDKMATDIEIQLYKLFNETGPKYRTKYRSLIFNIKDVKNQTLWRRICEKTITPAQLVRLTPDEMASQELAKWREQENKHQLDMIKKSELEMLTINRTYVLKTHKGEQVMEDRPAVKVDSTDIMPGLGADSTSEDTSATDKPDTTDHSGEKRSTKHNKRDRDRDKRLNKDRISERSSSKEHRSKEHKSSRSKRSRSRERDRDRDRDKSSRKRSRSRDRHHRSSHKSSRHKRDKHSTDHLDKRSREILDNLENNKLGPPPPEDRLWKHVPQQDIQVTTPDSDSDHEPTSTVTIPTSPRSLEQEDVGKQPEVGTSAGSTPKNEPKTESDENLELGTKAPRIDPRLSRTTSVETTPRSESPPVPVTQQESTSPPGPSTATPTPAKYTSESRETIVWEGNINMVDVAKFIITLHEVSGDCSSLRSELPQTLEIVGRISPDTVWDYIGKMKRSNSKLISILRLTAGNVEEKMPYIALYSYLSSRSRLGVIKSTNSAVKDFYILPLASHAPVPQALLPLSGPGFEESRPNLLLGIIVRTKRKRGANQLDIVSANKRSRIEDSPTTNSQPAAAATTAAIVTAQPPRSYTPPPARDPRIRLPTVPAAAPVTNDDDEPYSPEDSDPENTMPVNRKIPATVTKPASLTSAVAATATVATTVVQQTTTALKSSDISTVLAAATLKTTAFLETAAAAAAATVPASFEPFANKFDAIPADVSLNTGLDVDAGVDSLQRKMAELDKCIEKQKEEIRSISQDIVSSGAAASMATNLSSISLPSNLQQILDSIKNIPSTGTSSQDAATEEYCPTAPGYKTTASDELTIPLLLPKLSSRTTSAASIRTPSGETAPTIPLQLPVTPRELPTTSSSSSSSPPPVPGSESITLPNLTIPPPTAVLLPNLSVPPPSTATIPLNLPNKPKPISKSSPSPAQTLIPPGTAPVIIPSDKDKPASVLSSLSEEELIRKAAEMLGEAEPEVVRNNSPSNVSDVIGAAAKVDEKFLPTSSAQTAFKSAPIMYTAPPPIVSGPPPSKRTKIDVSQPPIPGLEDEY